MKPISFVCCVIVLASTPLSGLGQSSREWQPAKILELPTATVPYAVKKSGLGGNVRVRVNVDDKGNVTGVVDTTGPDGVCPQVDAPDVVALRAAAAQAALLAKFSPATSGGKPISSYAWLDFDFPRPDLKKDSVVADPDGTVEKYSISPGASENVNSAVGGPMVKGTARRIPKPPYPKEGRAVRAEGSVSILVMIDERGNVFSANALSGHHLLRPAAVEAACEATFSPTTFNGVPMRVSATISYNFVP